MSNGCAVLDGHMPVVRDGDPRRPRRQPPWQATVMPIPYVVETTAPRRAAVMPISTRHAEGPQAPSTPRRPFPRNYDEPTPREIARKQRNIRIARAVALVARTGCDCSTAARNIDLCDQRRIPRKHNWGLELRVWEMLSRLRTTSC
jgi:hypothetical protein